MEIFFDPRQHRWGHRRAGKTYIWGKQQTGLGELPYSPHAVPFTACRRKNRVGPLVGILTSEKGVTFAGNRKTFRHIHHTLQRRGGIVFVFTPHDAKRHFINGAVFHQAGHRWINTHIPYPDVVYNRVPFRKEEAARPVQLLLKRLRSLGIPYFNSGFFDKWQMYKNLRENPELAPCLPATRKAASVSDLQDALYSWEELYAKPAAGQQGEGIWAMALSPGGAIVCSSHKQIIRYPSIERLWNRLHPHFENSRYLLQEKIQLTRHNGRPYDFRLLLQKKDDQWECTGVGVRAAGRKAVTTHVPKGGKLLALEELHPPADKARLEWIAKTAALQLEKRFSPLYELSFDIGRGQNGEYRLFEANAKPMVFDEPEIEEKRMERLVDTFYELSDF